MRRFSRLPRSFSAASPPRSTSTGSVPRRIRPKPRCGSGLPVAGCSPFPRWAISSRSAFDRGDRFARTFIGRAAERSVRQNRRAPRPVFRSGFVPACEARCSPDQVNDTKHHNRRTNRPNDLGLGTTDPLEYLPASFILLENFLLHGHLRALDRSLVPSEIAGKEYGFHRTGAIDASAHTDVHNADGSDRRRRCDVASSHVSLPTKLSAESAVPASS